MTEALDRTFLRTEYNKLETRAHTHIHTRLWRVCGLNRPMSTQSGYYPEREKERERKAHWILFLEGEVSARDFSTAVIPAWMSHSDHFLLDTLILIARQGNSMPPSGSLIYKQKSRMADREREREKEMPLSRHRNESTCFNRTETVVGRRGLLYDLGRERLIEYFEYHWARLLEPAGNVAPCLDFPSLRAPLLPPTAIQVSPLQIWCIVVFIRLIDSSIFQPFRN